MTIIKKISACFPIAGLFLMVCPVLARENVTDWYIKDFQTEIVVNRDSSLDITERIAADCGELPDKHGIFRILPETINIPNGKIKTPVKLVSITDFSGHFLEYSQTRNRSDNTVAWKIGDPNRTVAGINEYLIRYHVKNAIRFDNPDFDEFYWNLNGNFWEIETDNFSAKIIFPPEIKRDNSAVEYYTGQSGSKYKNLADYRWSSGNILEFNSLATLKRGEGITASVAFPKNIITPYQPDFRESYGRYFWLLIPLVSLIFGFYLWWKFGKDPRVDKTVIAEYDIPGNLAPMELGMLRSNGRFDNNFITAEIINMAVAGFLKIEEANDKILFFNFKNYIFTKIPNVEAEKALNEPQKKILEKLFEGGNSVKLSDLKNKFPAAMSNIRKKARQVLEENGLITKTGFRLGIGLIFGGTAMNVAGFFAFFSDLSVFSPICLILAGIIILLFGLIMPKRTPKGAELDWEIKGFKLFMETAEKYRAQFNEKENIFERLLPYAIVFGMVKEWIKKMEEIYGADYYARYSPTWYVGSLTSFNAGNFSDSIENLSKSIAANTSSSSSGAGGGGSSGGGGGGGGGGGW